MTGQDLEEMFQGSLLKGEPGLSLSIFERLLIRYVQAALGCCKTFVRAVQIAGTAICAGGEIHHNDPGQRHHHG